jgi:hypothetical protein
LFSYIYLSNVRRMWVIGSCASMNTLRPKTILKYTTSPRDSNPLSLVVYHDFYGQASNVLQYSEGIRGAKSMPVGLKPNFCPSTASPPTMLFIPYWTDLLSHRQDNSHRFTSTYILKPTQSRMGRFPSTILLVIVLVFLPGVIYKVSPDSLDVTVLTIRTILCSACVTGFEPAF